MEKAIYTLVLLSWLGLNSVQAQDYQDPQNMPVEPENTDCQSLPEEFSGYKQALELIEASRFYYQQNIKTTRKQGLMEAAYYSCDFKQGYLVVVLDGKKILHQEVPLEQWEEFQQTPDIDGYYLNHFSKLPRIQDD